MVLNQGCARELPRWLLQHVHASTLPQRSPKFIFGLSYTPLLSLSPCLSLQFIFMGQSHRIPSIFHIFSSSRCLCLKSTLPFSTWQAPTHPSNAKIVISAVKTSLLHPPCTSIIFHTTDKPRVHNITVICVCLQFAYEFFGLFFFFLYHQCLITIHSMC